jgi:hypothetical protein
MRSSARKGEIKKLDPEKLDPEKLKKFSSERKA